MSTYYCYQCDKPVSATKQNSTKICNECQQGFVIEQETSSGAQSTKSQNTETNTLTNIYPKYEQVSGNVREEVFNEGEVGMGLGIVGRVIVVLVRGGRGFMVRCRIIRVGGVMVVEVGIPV